jgi:putative glutamine transport system substrate-binding protein
MKSAHSKTLFTVCILLLTALTAVAQSTSDTWAAVKNRKSGKVTALFLQEDAFAYIDASGKPAGVEIDIFNQFQNWLKHTKGVTLDVTFVPEPSFQKFYSSVQKGPNNMIGLGTVTIMDRRKTEVTFAPPFINNIALLVTHSSVTDLPKLSQIADVFAGKKAIVAKGTTLEEYMLALRAQYYPGLKIETVPSQMDVVKKVAEDPSYFAYMDLSIYWPAYDKENLPIKRHAAGDLSAESFGFIMPVGSDWVEPLTEFFNIGSGYRATTSYKAILMKHLGGEVTKMLHLTQQRNQALASPQSPR